MKRILIAALPALVAFGIAACDRPNPRTTDRSAQTSQPPAAASTPAQADRNTAARESTVAPAADAVLSEKVRDALLSEKGLTARDLQVSASNGVVTLSGKIEEKSDKDRMMLVAMSVEGVRSVVSNLVLERPT